VVTRSDVWIHLVARVRFMADPQWVAAAPCSPNLARMELTFFVAAHVVLSFAFVVEQYW